MKGALKKVIYWIVVVIVAFAILMIVVDKLVPDWDIKVRDRNGKPVSDVVLQLCSGNTCEVYTTDDEGRIDFAGDASEYELSVLKVPEGYEYTGGDLVAKKIEELVVVLDVATDSGNTNDDLVQDLQTASNNLVNDLNDVVDDRQDNSGKEAVSGESEVETNKEEPAKIEAEPEAKKEADEGKDQYVPVLDRGAQFKFSTVDRSGVKYDDSVFTENKLTLVNLWEPWCGPCKSEMPDLNDLYNEYKDEGFMVLGVHGDNDNISQVLKQTGVTYPILDSTKAFSKILNTTMAYPTTFFVDSEGYIINISDSRLRNFGYAEGYYIVGSLGYNEWKAMIEELLSYM